jgi:hypothetical protein
MSLRQNAGHDFSKGFQWQDAMKVPVSSLTRKIWGRVWALNVRCEMSAVQCVMNLVH